MTHSSSVNALSGLSSWNDLKNTLGVVLMSLGIAYAGALFLLLVIKAGSCDDMYTEQCCNLIGPATGAGFVDWRIQRRQKSETLQAKMIY